MTSSGIRRKTQTTQQRAVRSLRSRRGLPVTRLGYTGQGTVWLAELVAMPLKICVMYGVIVSALFLSSRALFLYALENRRHLVFEDQAETRVGPQNGCQRGIALQNDRARFHELWISSPVSLGRPGICKS